MAQRTAQTSDCEHCGKSFTRIASRAQKAKYCSKGCYTKASQLKRSVLHSCRYCGEPFKDSPSVRRVYCSKACVNKAEKTVWKATFATVRKAMLRRGLLTQCVRCGYDTRPDILGVHHKDRNRNNNALDNLEVLCPNCHSLEHMKHTPHGFKE